MAINSISFTRTPQAVDDTYNWLEDWLLNPANAPFYDSINNVLTLDVMSNDLGGNAKRLYSIDDGGTGTFLTDLLVNNVNTGWEATAGGNLIRIYNGKIQLDISNDLASIGAAHLNGLGANQVLHDTFTYAIQLGNGTLSWATVTVDIQGVNDGPVITSGSQSGNVSEGDDGASQTATGQVTFTDVDVGDTHTFSVIAVASYGAATVDPDGTWHYTVGDAGAVDRLAVGEHLSDSFTVQVDDHNGGVATQVVNIDIVGTNDAPVVEALAGDSAGTADPLAETNAGLAASGTLTVTDVDLTDTVALSVHAVSATGPTGGLSNADLLAFFSVAPASLAADPGSLNNLDWAFNSGSEAFNFLAQGEQLTLHYTVRATDDSGAGNNIGDGVVTIHIAGTNDAPVITEAQGSPATQGVVKEDSINQARGALHAIDPDDGAQQFWTVVGGSGAANADYHFRMESFSITRPGGAILLQDDFNDGVPPPGSPGTVNYVTNGGFGESGGDLLIDSNNAVPAISVGGSDPLVGNFATARTNIDPANTGAGLKLQNSFKVTGVFDLIAPDSPRESYGIRLTDRLVGGPGNPPDQLGDNTFDLVVRQNVAGVDVVQLRHIDFAADVTTNLQTFVLNPPPGADHIRLVFDHTASSNFATASFEFLVGTTVVGSSTSFTVTAPIFAPGTQDTETWTRASIVTYAPATSDSLLSGQFGTLDIDQSGAWTYTLDNGRTVTQNLAEGQHATDTFTVKVADQYGAFDTKTINIDVVGTNDAPTMQTPAVSRSLTEDSAPTLTATGLAKFSDVDLTDTHAVAATLQSASLSGGAAIPSDLAALLDGAMTTHIIDLATGDSDGELQWDFALDNNAVDFLAQDQTLTLVYDVDVTDTFGATATQALTITIHGLLL